MMQKDDYVKWLKKWLFEKSNMPTDADCNNFFTEGWLDSFKTLELILDIEKAFKIQLSDSIFNDPRFSTINGLSEILFEQPTL